LIHDGQRFLGRQVYLSRYLAYQSAPPRLPVQGKIRVLLVSARPIGEGLQLPDIEQQALRDGIAKAEGQIQLERLSEPTWKDLSRYLTDNPVPQVLHFDGHGLFGKQCCNDRCRHVNPGIVATNCPKCQRQLPEAQGFLVFEDEQGQADYVSATSFAALLPGGVALVVLSACQSGMAISGDSVFNGTAQQLIDARVPAVVAMQYSVNVQEASRFVEQFYRVLGTGKSVLEATNEGRKWMGVDGNQWYRPVVYLRWRDNHGGQMFTEESGLDAGRSGLSRFERLELGRLQTQLEDLEADYESVKDQLRVELTSTTQNKLKRQIQQLGQEMDETEKQLARLGQCNE
jgi:CHAT domain/Effector-associated domain 9